MASLVKRVRTWSVQRPAYNIDLSDDEADTIRGKPGVASEKPGRIASEDTKDDACQYCGESGNLLECETCNYAYHPNCLVTSLKAHFPADWNCPECVGPLSEIEKILDHEVHPSAANDSDTLKLGSKQIFVKQYLVKWKGLSYLHCAWVPEKEFAKAYKKFPRLKTKVNNFHRQMSSLNNLEDEYVAIRPEWTTVDRILAFRGDDDEKEYFVKWKELGYDECYWELELDIITFQPEIERFHKMQSRHRRRSEMKSLDDAAESQKKNKEFQQCEQSPEFLTGGLRHPYQLEGLNFLRFSWSKHTHVILADELGLGKTIQSIAFLASLFEEGIYPHLVVAPLSTLCNWEREFATWAPQINVILYVGSSQARSVIREHEFYYPKMSSKLNKKKPGQIRSESKQDRIKFDVLLTSYEMIIFDSAALKPISWACMIVDEGHRLKNKELKLFLTLTQYSTRHRVLLMGMPLQNNLDELYMLMHFLDAGKFGSLEEFQEEFKDINQEEQISRLHKMLAPYLLRRLKKDVMKELPPKKELILRVELSSKQKEYYKAILTRNYELLTRRGDAQISLINVVMELRKLCCHPYMLEGVEPLLDDPNAAFKQFRESSGKLQLLDKMMVKLKEQGHRVLIYSQFQNMLDILEDYMTHKQWQYERIDGKVGGAERQTRINRFNANNSSKFCFILSTKSGGLGINLATADTVIIYDSDWNPHADLQAMVRAHRLGQTNKVMIFRLIARGSIEERMMQMTKKKMVLEHLVVGKLKTQNINQEKLDDIIRYGSQELFADETEEAKLRQIHYDDIAIDRLLDRERVGNEETTLDDEVDNEFLKAFKMANYEYIEESEAAAEEETQQAAAEAKTTVNNSEMTSFWEELLIDKYEVHKGEELNSTGKGNRSRKQMVSVEDDDLAGLEDISSDGEDDNYEAELSDNEPTSSGAASGRKSESRKRARAENMEPLPLMKSEGRSLRVLGFNQSQRTASGQVLMRFGGEFDCADFVPRLKEKDLEEITEFVDVNVDVDNDHINVGNEDEGETRGQVGQLDDEEEVSRHADHYYEEEEDDYDCPPKKGKKVRRQSVPEETLDGDCPGGPSDPELIPSFFGHHIYAFSKNPSKNRDVLGHYSQSLKCVKEIHQWKVEGNLEAILQNSGLYHLSDCMFQEFDMPLISAFVDRWQPDTNSFHMPFGEMTILLHDVEQILGLPSRGRQCYVKNARNVAKNLLPKVLQLPDNFDIEVNKYRCLRRSKNGMFKLLSPVYDSAGIIVAPLMDMAIKEGAHDENKAVAYLLGLVGMTLFTGSRRDRIPVEYLSLIQNDDTHVKDFAWGPAALTFLYRQLGKATRLECKAISGCLTLLQTWIYVYFPEFRPTKIAGDTEVPFGSPVAMSYAQMNIGMCKNQSRYLRLRKQIDAMHSDSVLWLPYADRIQEIPTSSLFLGTLRCMDVTESYQPHRCMRQLGYVQIIPWMGQRPVVACRPANVNKYVVQHAADDSWERAQSVHVLRLEELSKSVDHRYMKWYYRYSHPLVYIAETIRANQAPAFDVDEYVKVAYALSTNIQLMSECGSNSEAIGNLFLQHPDMYEDLAKKLQDMRMSSYRRNHGD